MANSPSHLTLKLLRPEFCVTLWPPWNPHASDISSGELNTSMKSRRVSKHIVEVGLSGRSVEGLYHVEAERAITDGQWKGESWWAKRNLSKSQ